MNIQVRLTESDDEAARFAWLLHHPRVLLRRYWYSLATVCLVAIGIILKPEYWRLALVLTGAALGAVAGNLVAMRRHWHDQFAKAGHSAATTLITVDKRGVTTSCHGEQETHSWTQFTETYESKRVFILEEGYGKFVYLPKHAMSVEQLIELRAILASLPKN